MRTGQAVAKKSLEEITKEDKVVFLDVFRMLRRWRDEGKESLVMGNPNPAPVPQIHQPAMGLLN